MIRGSTLEILPRYVYVFGSWEPIPTLYMSRHIQPGDVVVDVGANVGYFTLLASGLVGRTGKVIAIEASPHNFCDLQTHLSLNAVKNVRALNVAASDCKGVLRLYEGEEGHRDWTSTIPSDELGLVHEADVPCSPVADLLQPDELQRVRLIKIDVEGGELAVVRGLQPLLSLLPFDVQVVCEVNPKRMKDPSDAAHLMEIFDSAGFQAYDLTTDYSPIGVLRGLRSNAVLRPFEDPFPTTLKDLVFMRPPDHDPAR